jgi:hypothetical protein
MFNYENWCNQCAKIEMDRLNKKLVNNDNIESLLENFSHRLLNKYLDPIYQSIYLDYESDYDPTASLNWYTTNYLDKINPKPDHIEK